MKLTIVILTALLSFNAVASDYQTDIDQFFKLYQAGKINEAVDSIYQSNQYVSSVRDQVINVKNQMATLEGLIGEVNNIVKIDTYHVSDQFVHVTYLVTYDRQPMRFEFQFFKVNEGWRIYSFSFDDIANEIKEIARLAALSRKE